MSGDVGLLKELLVSRDVPSGEDMSERANVIDECGVGGPRKGLLGAGRGTRRWEVVERVAGESDATRSREMRVC